MKRTAFEIGGVRAASLALMGLANACHATHRDSRGAGGAPLTATPRTGSVSSSSDDGAGDGGWANYHFSGLGSGAVNAADESITNPCGSEYGPTELCDTAHLGYDDTCNGVADEGCSCSPGAVHWCFEGDPSYRHAPGCFDGAEMCSESDIVPIPWGIPDAGAVAYVQTNGAEKHGVAT